MILNSLIKQIIKYYKLALMNYQFWTCMLSKPIVMEPDTTNFIRFLPSQHSQVFICTVSE